MTLTILLVTIIKISLSVANSGAPGASLCLAPASIVRAGTTGTAPYHARLPRIEDIPFVANLAEVTTGQAQLKDPNSFYAHQVTNEKKTTHLALLHVILAP